MLDSPAPQQQTCHIYRLPNELLVKIFAHLDLAAAHGLEWVPDDGKRPALVAVSSTSKRFHLVAQPVLWRRLAAAPTSWRGGGWGSPPVAGPYELLVQACEASPINAQACRSRALDHRARFCGTESLGMWDWAALLPNVEELDIRNTSPLSMSAMALLGSAFTCTTMHWVSDPADRVHLQDCAA